MYLQNHDMDDLFRSAATHYPLRIGESDWETIEQELVARSEQVPTATVHQNSGRKYYALLSLILVSFLFHNSIQKTASTNNENENSNQPRIVSNPAGTMNNEPKGRKIPSYNSTMPIRETTYKPNLTEYDQRSMDDWNRDMVISIPKYIDVTGTPNTEQLVSEKIDLPEQVETGFNEIKRPKSNQRGFYLGAFAGIDWGTVKGQSLTNPGFNVGLMAGYRFNKHWSFELGMSLVQKNYFTAGKHFSMKKIDHFMPGGVEMLAVQGQLTLFEFPYKIKYDFLLKEKSNFFITAGGSSNIYVKETNDYFTQINGVQELMHATYDDVHCSPLCMIHISAGYERRLRNQSRLRFEPYLKFPLQKVGMGSVPVLNIGLNVSVSNFTKR